MEKNARSSPSYFRLPFPGTRKESVRPWQSQAPLWDSHPSSIADLHQNRTEVIFRHFQNLVFWNSSEKASGQSKKTNIYLKISKFSTVSMRNSPLRECQVQPKLTLCWCHSWTWKRSFKIKMMVKRIFGKRQHCHWWQTSLVEPWWQGWILPLYRVPQNPKGFPT